MRKLLIISIMYMQAALSAVQYPATEKSSHADEYFGTIVPDPYRWLEQIDDPAVQWWVKAQNQFTNDYLAQIPQREAIKQRLTELYKHYSKFGLISNTRDYLFFSENTGQNQPVVYMQKFSEEYSPEIFIDPNTLSSDGTTSVSLVAPSRDGKYFTISVSDAGSDWVTLRIVNMESKEWLDDELNGVKFPSVAWNGKGFYYSKFDTENDELFGSLARQKIYYHRLGSPQNEDEIVFDDPITTNKSLSVSVQSKHNLLFVTVHDITTGDILFAKDLSAAESSFYPIIEGFQATYAIPGEVDDGILFVTNADAPNSRLLLANLTSFDNIIWKEIIPERAASLEWVNMIGGKLIARYLEDGTNHAYQYTLEGVLEKEIPVPSMGTVSSFFGNKRDSAAYFTYTSFNCPTTIYKYDVVDGVGEIWKKPTLPFNTDDFAVELVFYPSKDGTEIPMFIVHAKDFVKDGSSRALLYGYGGFGINVTPSFNPANILLLENNAIYAVPLIRGGGEYGTEWHDDGRLLKKQNVFDDFISAAEYLIREGYTSSNRLAIHGRSNGGLLIGACMTQRPELFKVCFPDVGVLDMLRFHTFTVGRYWVSEYGISEDAQQFLNLFRYSPLHNVKEGTCYPATMVLTSDHDNRVYPAHSFKFAAALQEKNAGDNPILIRIETNTGHGAGKPVSKLIGELTDFYAFLFYHTNVNANVAEISE